MNNDFIFHPPQIPPNPPKEIAARLDGQDEAIKELFLSLRSEIALNQAQQAAIRALISVTPNPAAALENHMHHMDLMADHIGKKNIELFREEAQDLANTFLAEVNRREA